VLGLLRTRRWLGFTALVLIAVVAFGLLSRWQWTRAEDKRVERDRQVAESALPLEGIDALVAPGGTFTPDLEWRRASATGAYDQRAQVLVRNRPFDGRNGMWVLTPLDTPQGVLWVNRGWIPAAGDARSSPSVVAPPSGAVTVTGWLRPLESAPVPPPGDLPEGQVSHVDPVVLPPTADQMYPTYLQVTTSTPEQSGLILLPAPLPDDGQNISYAVQWSIFASVALVGWWYFLRREAREDAETHPDRVDVAGQ
jgi:cytochrome oxidase assembly protein ShyY1